MSTDRDKGEEAVAKILEAFYRSLDVPPPAPGVERLAFLAVEAAYGSLRAAWEEDLLAEIRGNPLLYLDSTQPEVEEALRAMKATSE